MPPQNVKVLLPKSKTHMPSASPQKRDNIVFDSSRSVESKILVLHLTQMTCSELRAVPQHRQNFRCPVGLAPQRSQTLSVSMTPQLVQCLNDNPSTFFAGAVFPSGSSIFVSGRMRPVHASLMSSLSVTLTFSPFSP